MVRRNLLGIMAAGAVVMAAFGSCTQDLAEVRLEADTVVTAGIAGTDTKTYTGALETDKTRKMYWENGDAISINGHASNALAGLEADAATASFSFAAEALGEPYKAVYPASVYKNETTVSLPAEQTNAREGSFDQNTFPMAAYSAAAGDLTFRHLCAAVKISMIGLGGVSHLEFRGNSNEQVSGDFTIDYQTPSLTGASTADADKVVKVVLDKALKGTAAVDAYIVVPAITFANGFTVKIVDTDGLSMEVKAAGSRTFTPGLIANMPAVTVETLSGCYKTQKHMHYGGTGPEYGGAELVDPSKKEWMWYSNGYGPKAEYDNYFELKYESVNAAGNAVGTCVYYAGVDGKFWNCTVLAEKNKEGTTDIDLRKFYRLIPMGESRWERNFSDGTVTFTDAKGKKTVAKLMEEGSHFVFTGKNNVQNYLEVTNHAFDFKLEGKDNWTEGIIYSDYDKFTQKVRNHYILFEKVDEIPAASKTEGTDGIIEQEPGTEDETLEGSYKINKRYVLAGNKSGAVAFFDYREKGQYRFYDTGSGRNGSNDKLDNDNILKLSEESVSGTVKTGTAEYLPGADGQYWDYKGYTWNTASGSGRNELKLIDASLSYKTIPEGTSTYSFDTATGIITFTQGETVVSANFKSVGEHAMSYDGKTASSKLTVTSGFGLDFKKGPFTNEQYGSVFNSQEMGSDNTFYVYLNVYDYVLTFTKQ